MPRRRFGFLGLCGLFLAAAAPAQDTAAPPAGPTYLPGPFRGFVAFDDRYAKVLPPRVQDDLRQGKAFTPDELDKLRVRDPNDRTGKIHCLVCENGLAPVAAVFVRMTDEKDVPAAGSPLADLVKQLNAVLYQRRGYRPAAFVHFLGLKRTPPADPADPAAAAEVTFADDDRTTVDTTVEVNKQAQVFVRETIRTGVENFGRSVRDEAVKEFTAVKPPIPEDQKRLYVPLSLAAADGPTAAAYKLKAADVVTVVLYDRLREVKRFAFEKDKLTTDDAKAVAAAADAMILGRPVK